MEIRKTVNGYYWSSFDYRKFQEPTSSFRSRRRRSSGSPSPLNDRSSDRFINRKLQSNIEEELTNRNSIKAPNFDRKILAKIKIQISEFTKDEVDVKRRKRLEKGITTLEQVLQLTQSTEIKGTSSTCYNSQEFETPPNKELKKIQV